MPDRDWQKDMERCRKATPGPWYLFSGKVPPGKVPPGFIAHFGGYANPETGQTVDVWVGHLCTCASDERSALDDAWFTIEARTGWPAALEKIRELEEENRKLRAVAEGARELFNCCGCLHYSEDSYSDIGYSWDCDEDYCPLDKIRQALAALKAEEEEK